MMFKQWNRRYLWNIVLSTFYYIISATNGRYLLSDWMANLPLELHEFRLTEIAIPGSHDSGSFSIAESSDIFLPELTHKSDTLKKYFKKEFDHDHGNDTILKKLILRWSRTQDLNISQQLEKGVRYFDLRLAHMDTGQDFIVHGLVGTTLVDILNQVSIFSKLHKREMIILDFNHIYLTSSKMNLTSVTDSLKTKLLQTFGTRLCSAQEVVKSNIKEVWATNCQIISFFAFKPSKRNILAYPSPSVIKSPFNYGKFTQKSPWLHFLNLNYKKERSKGTFYVTQGIMQPHWMEVIVAGLSEKATLKEWVSWEATNHIIEWLHNKHIGKNGINIVISDFIEYHNFPEKVIRLNYALSLSSCSQSLHTDLSVFFVIVFLLLCCTMYINIIL